MICSQCLNYFIISILVNKPKKKICKTFGSYKHSIRPGLYIKKKTQWKLEFFLIIKFKYSSVITLKKSKKVYQIQRALKTFASQRLSKRKTKTDVGKKSNNPSSRRCQKRKANYIYCHISKPSLKQDEIIFYTTPHKQEMGGVVINFKVFCCY